MLTECDGCANHTLIRDIDGLYEADPKINPKAAFIKDIAVTELKARKLPTLPFDKVLIDLLACARQGQFQVINGLKPHPLEPALRGEHVGTIVRKGRDGLAPGERSPRAGTIMSSTTLMMRQVVPPRCYTVIHTARLIPSCPERLILARLGTRTTTRESLLLSEDQSDPGET